MSLYSNIAESLSKRGLTGAVDDGLGSVAGSVGGGITKVLGGGELAKSIGTIGAGIGKNAATGVINKYIPADIRRTVNIGAGAAGDILNGDFEGAGLRLLDSGLLREYLPGMDGVVSQQRYFGTPTPLFGGITPNEARKIYGEIKSNPLCRKNLFLIEVSSPILNDVSSRFNMFATELDYAPLTITGEKKKIGGAHIDITNSADPVEMRLTTMDDQTGFIKTWFEAHCAAAAARDGTIGVPASYMINITIVHGFVTTGSTPSNAYKNKGLFRPANMEVNLSRREDSMQELQLTFVQLDTFMKV